MVQQIQIGKGKNCGSTYTKKKKVFNFDEQKFSLGGLEASPGASKSFKLQYLRRKIL
jgi:hypothetical protein